MELWWESPATTRMADVEGLRFGIQELVEGALIHSSRIRVLSLQPAIRRTELAEEAARFNWKSFLETKFDNQNDPIGNTLTTGNDSRRFTQETASLNGGVKRTNRRGGEVQLSQRLWYLENNSRFLDPNPQGNTRLELQYTQPLLNGAGRAVNESRIALADIAVGTADDQWVDDLQQHLEAVSQAYWELYFARCDALQRQRLLQRAQEIREILLSRQTFDGDRRQFFRAETAVASRQSEIVRAMTQVRNAEAQVRLLVNDATLGRAAELTPREIPAMTGIPFSMGESLRVALLYRRDVSRAIRDIHSSTVQLGVARNQVLPKLDLMVSSYVAGLEGNGDAVRAYGNQFADGRPGYAFGLLFEAPFHNDAAQARAARSRLELQRAVSGFEWTVQQGLTQVELAVREVSTTHQEVSARHRAMLASRKETEYLLDRWRTIAGVDDSAANLLENLLDSQVRLAEEERNLVRAQVNYAIAILRLKREMGTLVQVQGCN
jgi:outer membrane protein TolC